MTDVLVDVTRLLGRLLKGRLATGVDRVDLAYVEHFAARARAVVHLSGRHSVLSKRASERVFARLIAQRESLAAGVLAEVAAGVAAGLAEAVPAGAVYLNTGHSGLTRPHALHRLRCRGLQPVFMVHDLIPITHHEYCREGEYQRHTARMHAVLETAATVLVNSNATSEALAQFAAASGRRLPPLSVVPLAPGLRMHPPGSRLLAAPYFLVVSTIEPRKNLAFLLQVWRRLAERHGGETPRLVIIGQRGWECENVVDLLERCEPLRGLVIERGACPDAELSTWVHHAQALLFPSFVEGYGLPLLEALQAGTPVIASDLPVFREIAGRIPEYVDPL
ncbi:MAG TPA: glycosyltransferase family 1 protein, partial [Burkholderiaceae bacterium]|nr:glycosyltransferase family 1 protein [Burkholderiaceae bacterium]